MARGMNHVLLVGAAARDPELRYTPSGTAVFEVTLAGEDHIVGQDGKDRKLPWYHRVTVLGKPAEWYAERNWTGGATLLVEGSLEYSAWDDPNGGGKRSMVRVKAQRIEEVTPPAELVHDAGGGVRLAGGVNEVWLIGNITRELELRYTPAGDAVIGAGVAVNEAWNDRQGQRQEKTHWIDVTFWRALAESVRDAAKGQGLYVKGRLMNESWTDRDGNKRNTTKVEVQDFQLLAVREGGQGGGQRQGGQQGGQRAAQRPAQGQRQQGAQGGGRPPQRPPARPTSGGLDIDQGLDDFPPDEEDLPF
ncbi:single-stranded DNA-binding protein [Deinococcus kurensis]|uniref:single-stranded DNA-binding protein n=1 Tax=Deinococcus kurensis TaxID=2662757 RepID=UPI0012D2E1EF|nr:single-stranded DNA-binding protein [Deinococcus kurensis]